MLPHTDPRPGGLDTQAKGARIELGQNLPGAHLVAFLRMQRNDPFAVLERQET
ncbi:hypothetical protein P4110_01855 [Pseudomonas aeruginosa]|nr:hypothetical protein [Pseudomonas aeruginosa]